MNERGVAVALMGIILLIMGVWSYGLLDEFNSVITKVPMPVEGMTWNIRLNILGALAIGTIVIGGIFVLLGLLASFAKDKDRG